MKSIFRVTLLSVLVSVCLCVTQGPPPSPPSPMPETAMKCECTCTHAGKPQNLYRASGNFVGSVQPVTTSATSGPSTVTNVTASSDVNKTTTNIQNTAENKTTATVPQNTTSSTASATSNTTSKAATPQPTVKSTKAFLEPRIRFVDVASDKVVSLSPTKKDINSDLKSKNVTKSTSYTVGNGLSSLQIQNQTSPAISMSKTLLPNKRRNVFSFAKKDISISGQKLSFNRKVSNFKLPKIVKYVGATQTHSANNEGTLNVKVPMPKYRLPNDERFNARSQSEPSTTTRPIQDIVVMSNWPLGEIGKSSLGVLSAVNRSRFKNTFKNHGIIIESIEKTKKANIMPQKLENSLAPKEQSKFIEQNIKNTEFVGPNKPKPTTVIVIPDPPKKQEWSSSTTSATQWQHVSTTPGTWSFGGNWNEGNLNQPGQMWRGQTTTPAVPGNSPTSFKTGRNIWMSGPPVGQNMQNKNANQGVTIPTTEPMPPSMTMAAMEQMGGQPGMEVQPPEMPQYNMQGMHFPMGEFPMNPFFYNQQMK